METMVLEKMINKAEEAFERNEYTEAIGMLEDVLTIEPCHSKAHNHLGWAYLFRVNDWVRAEKHLRIALKSEAVYGAAYIHIAHILFNKSRFDELFELLLKAENEGTVEKSFIYNEYGRVCEIQGKFRKAIQNYKKAICFSFDDKELGVLRENIHRCRNKR